MEVLKKHEAVLQLSTGLLDHVLQMDKRIQVVFLNQRKVFSLKRYHDFRAIWVHLVKK